jgi:hypothetical protein
VRRRRRLVAAIAALATGLAAGSCARPADGTLPPFAVEPLTAPAGPESAAAQLSDEEGHLVLSWLEPDALGHTLKFSEFTANAWSPARSAASSADIMVNASDVPSVTRLPDGTFAAHWLEHQGGASPGYDVRLSWSTDQAHTWSPAVIPYADRSAAEHGFASLFQPADGGVGIVWLDGRDLTATAGGAASGATSLRAASFAPDGTPRGEVVVDDRVCDCCPTSMARDGEGLLVAYRDRQANEIRDIAVSRLAAGQWSAPVTVHEDGWVTSSCPVNGPSVSTRGDEVLVAWFTGEGGRGRGYVSFSGDGGRTFDSPIAIDDDVPVGRVRAVLLPDGTAAVCWVGYPGTGSELRLRRIDRDRHRSPPVVVAERMGTQHPRLAASGDAVVLAWVDASGGSSEVKTALAVTAAAQP